MVKSRGITWLMLACVDFDGWSENRVLIAVVGVESLSENKDFFYTVAFG